jgi:hypothetical protein
MAGVECVSSEVIDNNTVEYIREDGTTVIRLHLTDIVQFLPSGHIVLNSGGWRTPTTKARMNDHLSHWHIWQERGVWFVGPYSAVNGIESRYLYHDGMVIDPDGETTDAKPYDAEAVKARNAERRRIRKYAKDFIKAARAGDVPAPGGGDCWCCLFKDTKSGETWGETSQRGSDEAGHHIRGHIEESYFVGSLLHRAAEAMGVSRSAMDCLAILWADNVPEDLDPDGWPYGIGWEQLEKALYRYCAQQLGHAV